MIRTRPPQYNHVLHREDEDEKAKARRSRAGSVRKLGASLTATTATAIIGVLTLIAIVLLLLRTLLSESAPNSNQESESISYIERSVPIDTIDRPQKTWMEVVSWQPRAFIYHNFLTRDECEHLIEIAKPHLERSIVVDVSTVKASETRDRTSSGTYFQRGHDKTVSIIEQRIADITFIPVEHGEYLQVLHYEEGEKYDLHHDFFFDEFRIRYGRQRIATILMYLSDVEEGGETVFPAAEGNWSSVPWSELSECGKDGLSVRPKMGDALLFWSLNPDTTPDHLSLHGGCPVIKGNKWVATKWVHVHPF